MSQVDFNKLDSQGKKHGFWKGFYEESKRSRYEGTFEHGNEIGKFQFSMIPRQNLLSQPENLARKTMLHTPSSLIRRITK
jgi:hypothetical protein